MATSQTRVKKASNGERRAAIYRDRVEKERREWEGGE